MRFASLFGYRFRSQHVYLLDIIDTDPRFNTIMNRSVFDYSNSDMTARLITCGKLGYLPVRVSDSCWVYGNTWDS